MSPAEAFRLAAHGDLGPAEAMLREGAVDGGARVALRTIVSLAYGELAEVDLEAAVTRDGDNALLAEACAYRILAHAIRFDPDAVARVAEVQRRIGAGELYAEQARVWVEFLAGNDITESAARLGAAASKAKAPALRIEATTLAALAAAAREQHTEAVAHARRGAHMARAEALIHHEYLANVVLARARRTSGNPHLAALILNSLGKVVPPVWRRWLDWEAALAGAFVGPGDVRVARDIVADALQGARKGKREETERTLAQLCAQVERVIPLHVEAEDLSAAIDPHRPPRPISSWASGRSGTMWGTMWDALRDEDAAEGPHAYVYAHERGARRIVQAGAGLLDDDVARLPFSPRRDARVMRIAAVLALAGTDGMSEPDLFEDAYGFTYREKHLNTLRVMLHRTRTAISPHALIERDGTQLTFKALRPLLVPDPRCTQSLEQRVMMLLGTHTGELSATAIAESLGASQRQVQRALKILREQGACAVRTGRASTYRIEDTTFREPTRSRVLPSAAQDT